MVLVVDDNVDTAAALRRMLKKKGYQVEALGNGYDALDYVKRAKPRLIVLDQMMPGMTGLEVLRKLRSDPDTKDIPVMFYSAGYDPDTRTEAMHLGAVDWITKGGFSWDGVLARVMQFANPPAVAVDASLGQTQRT
jgi:CheY-like chemotaxis protein